MAKSRFSVSPPEREYFERFINSFQRIRDRQTPSGRSNRAHLSTNFDEATLCMVHALGQCIVTGNLTDPDELRQCRGTLGSVGDICVENFADQTPVVFESSTDSL